MKPKYQIVEVPYGLANIYSDGIIEINQKLKGKLRKKILAHEKRHTLSGYSKKDLKNDFHSSNPYFFESVGFALKNPEALINFFLVMFSYCRKTFTFNSSAVYPFVYLGCIFTLFFFFLFKINPLLAFLGWFCIYTIINLSLLAYTHLYALKQGIKVFLP